MNLGDNGFEFISSRAINFDADGAPDQTIVVVSSTGGSSLEVCCAYEWMQLDRHFFTSGLLCRPSLPDMEMEMGPGAATVAAAAAAADLEDGSEGTGGASGASGASGDGATTIGVDFSIPVEISSPATQFGCCFSEGWAIGVEYMHSQTVGSTSQLGSYGSLNVQTRDYLSQFCVNEEWNGKYQTTLPNRQLVFSPGLVASCLCRVCVCVRACACVYADIPVYAYSSL